MVMVLPQEEVDQRTHGDGTKREQQWIERQTTP